MLSNREVLFGGACLCFSLKKKCVHGTYILTLKKNENTNLIYWLLEHTPPNVQ